MGKQMSEKEEMMKELAEKSATTPQKAPTAPPWLDLHLTKEAMDHLWDDINDKQKDARNDLAGNISKSVFIQDKDNWLYENVMKDCVEYLYYKDWNNYYFVHVTKSLPRPVFKLGELWVNYQKQHEFNPPHNHTGFFSFVVFMKIPTHWKEQHALPISANSNTPSASNFQFLFGHPNGSGHVYPQNFWLGPEDEGRMLFFPASMAHQVFPFYGTEKERITVSGNIYFPENYEEEKRKKKERERTKNNAHQNDTYSY